VGGTSLGKVFSRETEDEVASTLFYEGGLSAQLSVSWSDESHRKMGTRLTLWGTAGRIYADRQECQVYLRNTAVVPDGYEAGWNVRYTTELTEPVWFYLRGEEYSAQLADFVRRVESGETGGRSTFATALVADQVIEMLLLDSSRGPSTTLELVTGESGAVRPHVARRQRLVRLRSWPERRRERRDQRRARRRLSARPQVSTSRGRSQ
jgi:predicted dehydrogenase